MARPRLPLGLALFLLSPAIGELLSGSSPPAEFFSVTGLLFVIPLYGCGAVLVREARVRWRKGIGSTLLLGCSYGILEEGLMVASFFNTAWMDLGVLGVFGRWLEVNWVWAVELTLYHAVVSITIPIMLVELAYPGRRAEAWVCGRTLKAVVVVLGTVVIGGFLLFSAFLGYRPPPVQYFSAAVVMIVFVFMARRLPAGWARRGSRRMRRPLFYGLLGLAGSVACGLVFWVLPNSSVSILSPPVVIALGLLAFLGVVGVLRRHDWNRASDLDRFGLASGSLALLVVFALFQEFDRSRKDNPAGMTLVGLAFLVGLVLLGVRVRGRARAVEASFTNPSAAQVR